MPRAFVESTMLKCNHEVAAIAKLVAFISRTMGATITQLSTSVNTSRSVQRLGPSFFTHGSKIVSARPRANRCAV